MPTTGSVHSEKLPKQFDLALFVNRQAEIDEIRQKVRDLQQDMPVQQRTIRISGERGVGKTWLLLKLHRDAIKQPGDVLSIFIDFDKDTQNKQKLETGNWEFTVSDYSSNGLLKLLKDLSESLDISKPEETSIPEQAYWVLEKIKDKIRQGQVVVMLLDGLFAAPDSFVTLLENHLLAPLISLDRTLIIMTGRGRAPLFTNYALNNEAEDIRLRPFTEEELGTMFDKLKEEGFDALGKTGKEHLLEIYQASGGFPRTAIILAEKGLPGGIKTAIGEILAFIQKEDKRETVRQYLEALVLLNRWDPKLQKTIEWGMRDSDALRFLNAYAFLLEEIRARYAQKELTKEDLENLYSTFESERSAGKTTYRKRDLRNIRKELQDLQLLRWQTIEIEMESEEKKREVRGWFIDEAVRYPIAYAIRNNKPRLWRWLHYVGWKLFDGWAKTDTDKKKLFELLAEAHREAFSLPEKGEPVTTAPASTATV